MKFDPAAALIESTIVRYFQKGLKSSIKAKMDQNAIHLDDYKELVAKAVRAKAKTGLQLISYVQKTDYQVFQGSQPTHTIVHKVQSLGAIKDYCENKPRDKAPMSTSAQDFFFNKNKSRRDKKKKQHKNKRDSTIPTFRVNTAEVGDKKKRKKKKKNMNKIMCYNCNKMGH